MAKPLLVANWKNYPSSLSEAQRLLRELAKKRELFKKVSLFIAPPSPYLESVSNKIKRFGSLACQDISSLAKGTYTGEVTSEMLKSFAVRLAIVGHSERRALGETSKDVASKIDVALKSGIAPLVCIGELERDKDGEHFEFLRQELKLMLSGISKNEVVKIALAYEPVWAVGKYAKEAINPQELSQTVIFLRKVLGDLFGRAAADKVPILYGGSVEPANAGELMNGSGIRGFLVGRSSLNAESLEAIARDIISL
ncbi:MAG: triosephosphate isomerase [Candidatus Zambryskibacteria bacterium]|nr:triosephosphate isomerase [Candidatus Zambryskibacteria bacterium]